MAIITNEEIKEIEDIVHSQKSKLEQEENFDSKEKLKEIYLNIVDKIKEFMEVPKEDYNIIALWIIGTYFYKYFSAYPYLFFNAMKGSGKTRLLRLISYISNNSKGELIVSISEAVLFRTATQGTVCIDELERIESKDKQALRELLNSAYKEGGVVKRAYKKKGYDQLTGEKRDCIEVEKFEVYTPVAMANIWGMDNVIGDRCLTLMLEKSTNPAITRLIENFNTDIQINKIVRELLKLSKEIKIFDLVYDSASSDAQNDVYRSVSTLWNDYIYNIHHHTSHTHTTHTYIHTLFSKIEKTSLEGRQLELFFPLLILADICGVLEETILTAEAMTRGKREDEITGSKDIMLLDYVANHLYDNGEFVSIREIKEKIREETDDKKEEWLTSEWIGRSLKRLGILLKKRRVSKGMEVKIDFEKAKRRIKIFAPVEEIEIEKIEDNSQERLAS